MRESTLWARKESEPTWCICADTGGAAGILEGRITKLVCQTRTGNIARDAEQACPQPQLSAPIHPIARARQFIVSIYRFFQSYPIDVMVIFSAPYHRWHLLRLRPP
ncbi:hypothetical protein [Microbulbifer hainanensis]|uniref:hypothetical protein n=1 Tax=Microbulbifer hainanensis TaxID=2735675 RepID=UPI0018688891|nr:hypothetical protein [Microbulbifer hainanensis]